MLGLPLTFCGPLRLGHLSYRTTFEAGMFVSGRRLARATIVGNQRVYCEIECSQFAIDVERIRAVFFVYDAGFQHDVVYADYELNHT